MKKISAFFMVLALFCASWMPLVVQAEEINNIETKTYLVTVQDMQHGNVIIESTGTNKAEVKAGESVKVIVTPEESFTLEEIKVKTENNVEIVAKAIENGFEFKMAEEPCSIKAEFKEIPIVENPEVEEPIIKDSVVEEPAFDETILQDKEVEENKTETEIPQDATLITNTGENKTVVTRDTARGAGIEYYGKVIYKGTTVGAFTIDGNIAFCMEHQKPTPDTGTTFVSSIYNNINIQKVLYYGWAGGEQWGGFSSYEQGVVVTSLALSYYYSGPDTIGMFPHGNSAKANGLSGFLYFIEAKPELGSNKISLDKTFSNSKINGNIQQSENFTLNGSTANTVSIPLKSGMQLFNVTTGDIFNGGSAVVKGGDTFYLTAPLTQNETWSSGILSGSLKKYNAVLATTASSGLQDLGYGLWAVDPTNTINFSIKWEALGQIKVTKTDEETAAPIQGTEFTIYADQDFLAPDGRQIYTKGQKVEAFSTDTSGTALSKPTYLGKYRVIETKQTPGYLYESKEFFVELKPGAAVGLVTETFDVTNKSTDLIINKIDEKSGNVMPGVVFALQKISSDSVDPEFGNDKEFYTTDKNGSLSIRKLVPGRYLLGEYQQLPGYIRDDTQYQITVNDSGEISLVKKDTDPVNQSEDSVNKPKNILTLDIKNSSNRLLIGKSDLDSGKALTGVKFTFWKITQDDIDPGFSNQKETFLTDEKGEISFSKLPEGTYQLQETETLPGYIIDETLYIITVDDKGELSVSKKEGENHHGAETISTLKNELSIKLKNDVAKGKIEITKRDNKTSALLDGASFDVIAKMDIKSPDGTILIKQGAIVDQVTTSKGIANTKALPLGSYIVKESKSPNNYWLSDHEYSVELMYKDQKTPLVIEKLDITNEKKVSATAKTGDSTPLLPIILFVSASIGLIGVLLFKKSECTRNLYRNKIPLVL